MTNVTIESDDIYNRVTATTEDCLVKYASIVKVLKTIVDDAINLNSYVTLSNFNISTSGNYYVYSKK